MGMYRRSRDLSALLDIAEKYATRARTIIRLIFAQGSVSLREVCDSGTGNTRRNLLVRSWIIRACAGCHVKLSSIAISKELPSIHKESPRWRN